MISQSQPIRIPVAVEEKLLEVRVARDRARLATVAAIGLLTLLVAMSLAMLVDWTFTLFDPFWRSVLTATALGITACTLVAAAVMLWWRGRHLTAMAHEVDRAVPPIEERWWTVAELAAAPLEQQRTIHTGMINRLSHESILCERHVSVEEVVSLRGLLYIVLAACAVVLGLLAMYVIDRQETVVLVKRFWAPAANISATQLEVPEANVVAARGEPLLLEARQSGRTVEDAMLFLRTGDDPAVEQIPLSASGPERDRFVHRIKAAETSLSYRVRAGDGQSPWVVVTVADRPELAGARLRAVPPAYTGRESIDLHEWPGRVSIVEGSELEIALLPRSDVRSVEIKLGEGGLRQPLVKGSDGWYHFHATPTEDLTVTALLTEKHGLQNKRPPVCRIDVFKDRPPSVEVSSPSNDMTARPDDEIDIEFTASDDFGIAKSELVVYVDGPDDAELAVFDIPLGEQTGSTNVSRSVPLDLSQFHLKDGQSISYAIRVYDTRQSAASSGPNDDAPSPESETPSLADNADAAAPQTAVEGADRPGSPASSPSNEGTAPRASNREPGQPQAPTKANQAPKMLAESPPPSQPGTPDRASATAQTKPSDSATPASKSNPSSPARAEPSVAASDASAEPAAPRPQPSNPSTTSTDPTNNSTASTSSPQNSPPQSSSSLNSSPPPPNSQQPDNGSMQTGAPRPPDNMTRRTLDVAQSASSNRMRLNIDQWAGSFAARQREKLEMAISPMLEELDQFLARAENRLKDVMQQLEQDIAWTGPQDHTLGQAEQELADAIQVVADLNAKSAETPYAFIGLQLSEIASSHIVPAHDSVWLARQAQTNPKRRPPVESAWQQTGRARQRLKQLVTQYERVRREHHLTDAIENIKTMYQAFIEDSFELLDQRRSPINNYQRKIAELDVDEEYLKRLEEVLKMRQKLIAEFARILSEDPRLLRRFVESINSQSETLRDQLTVLAVRQQELDEELRTWVQLPEKVRERAAPAIIQKRLRQSIGIAEQTAQLQERFHTWSPLDLGVEAGDLKVVADALSEVAAAARQVETKAASWRPPPAEEISDEPTEDQSGEPDAAAQAGFQRTSLADVTAEGRKFYEQLRTLDTQMLELSGKGNDPDLASFLVRRLAELRELIALTSGWVYQLEQLEAGNYPAAAAVEQHQLAEETNVLTADLADLEQQLVGILGREDNTLPPEIAELSRSLLATLDQDVAGSQLGAVFALRRSRLPTAAERTQDAVKSFQKAEELFDELFKKVIEEADKLPVQDPIADLLDDPTLDELLRLLENEQDLAALLGIPPRPTNLQTIGDWLRRGLGGGGGIGPGMIMAQLNQGQRMLNRQAQRAMNRAEKEKGQGPKKRGVRRIEEWNVLASELENKLLQGRGQLPPERYRRAIEQYFEELSRHSAIAPEQNP